MSVGAIILNQAPSQLTRVLEAPQPDAVRVDGRDIAQLLAFAARFGPLVQFWDLRDHRSGNWHAFFAADPAVGHALHGALDLPDIETGLRRLLRECRQAATPHRQHASMRHLQRMLLRLVSVLDREPEGEGDLQSRWDRLLARQRNDALREPLQSLQRHGVGTVAMAVEGRMEKEDGRYAPQAWWRLLEELVSVLIDVLSRGRQAALDAADTELARRGHAPQAALYNAFALLFAEARQELNRFPRRLLDFYQGQVLKQSHVDARPDQVFLTAALAQDASQADIARGTLFAAGNDAQGQAIQYAADHALAVGPAAVSSLRIHRLGRLDKDADRPASVLTGIVAPMGGRLGGFPLFGGDQPGQFGALTMAPASLGFAVASPTLLLQGGQRQVRILLQPSGALPGHLADKVRTAVQAFALYYSTAGAWIEVQDVALAGAADGGHALALSFELPPEAPPMVALATPASAAPPIAASIRSLPASTFPAQGQPTIVAQLMPQSTQQAASVELYALLSLLEVATVTIQVSVRQLQPATLRSPDGELHPQQTMALLGLSPVQYGTLDIQAPELFVKPLSSLSLSITWAGLPADSDGFQGYYRSYVVGPDGQPLPAAIDNTSFLADFSLNTPGLWRLADSPPAPLFQTSAGACLPAGPVLQTSVLALPVVGPCTAPPYYDPASGALRMTLAAPAWAFGQALYAANLTAISSANLAALRTGMQPAGGTQAGASTQLAKAAAVNAEAPDSSHAKQVRAAVQQAVATLNGQALAALQRAVRQKVADPQRQADQLLQLDQAMAAASPAAGGWWHRLWSSASDAQHDIATRLADWATSRRGELAGEALAQALQLLESATGLGNATDNALQCITAVARPMLDAALQNAQQDVARVNAQQARTETADVARPLPNAPWLPQASAITLDYTAEATVTLQTLDASVPGRSGELLHLYPFSQLQPVRGRTNGVPLLPEVGMQAALYIDLSAPAETASLLFTLSTEQEIWSDEQPRLAWEQDQGDADWVPIGLLGDGTHGLLNSGIVSLQLLPIGSAASQPPRLRVRLLSGLDNMPWVSAVSSNALSATWVGPGGAEQLGTPLPAGSITQSVAAVAGLAGVQQPMASQGGRARLSGHSFDVWMAERLRHKGYASTGWDYARLCLEAIPTLWQVAVVPATDAHTGAAAPGKVWVIAVAGPATHHVTNPARPMVDASVLGEIHGLLSQLVSPFVDVQVSNPPYVDVTVKADVIFSDADTVDHWLARLQAELVRWLSPWPDPGLGPRPYDYYTREAVAEFIRQRDYVEGINGLQLHHDGGQGKARYYTSAERHLLKGRQGVRA